MRWQRKNSNSIILKKKNLSCSLSPLTFLWSNFTGMGFEFYLPFHQVDTRFYFQEKTIKFVNNWWKAKYKVKSKKKIIWINIGDNENELPVEDISHWQLVSIIFFLIFLAPYTDSSEWRSKSSTPPLFLFLFSCDFQL